MNSKIKLIGAISLLSLAPSVVAEEEKLADKKPIEYVKVDSIAQYIHSRVTSKIKPTEVVLDEELIAEKQRLSLLYADLLTQSKSKDLLIDELKSALSKQLSLGGVTQRYYFATDSRVLGGDQLEEASAILTAVSRMEGVSIVITGRADPRGNDEYNKRLAQSRIDHVAELAEKSGIPSELVKKVNLGEVGGEQENAENYFFQRHLTLELKKVVTRAE